MTEINWDKTIDYLQVALTWFIIGVVAICTSALIMFDILVGAGSMYFLTQGKLWIAFVISLATTGLLMSLMFIGYQLSQNNSRSAKNIGYSVAVGAFLVYCLDIYFDAMTADILRFGSFMSTHELNHNLFRALLGGISTIGEGMAIAIILGMPVLKSIINNAIPASYRTYTPSQPRKTYQSSVPSSIPRRTGVISPPNHTPPAQPFPKSVDRPTYHPVGMKILEEETKVKHEN